jgi:CBS domain-containing protein
VIEINLSERQKRIIEIVKNNEPITSKEIASKLNLTRGALRADLSVLTMASLLEAKPKVGYTYSAGSGYLNNLEDMYSKKVKEVKSVAVVVKKRTSVYDAIVKLFLEDVGSLFVIDDDEILVGILSRKDLLKMTIGETDINQMPVSVVMTRMPHLFTVKDDDTVFEAAKKIVDYEIDSLPVVEELTDQSGEIIEDKLKVIGRVSKTTIARVFVDCKLQI